MIKKKVPDAGEVYMVYDARDRLVLTQDANLRNQGKWMYTVYENLFNRLKLLQVCGTIMVQGHFIIPRHTIQFLIQI